MLALHYYWECALNLLRNLLWTNFIHAINDLLPNTFEQFPPRWSPRHTSIVFRWYINTIRKPYLLKIVLVLNGRVAVRKLKQ